jgi:hypothetical protein
VNETLTVLEGRLKTLQGLSESPEIKQMAIIVRLLISELNKKDAGFTK